MQTWAKRGIQTALVTGGLLMLGTSIASADEDVNPDKAASPLDGSPVDASLTVPLNIANNAAGTPLGEFDLPNITREVSVDGSEVTGNLPNVVPEAVAPIIGSNGDSLRGNRVAGDLVVPVDVSGNAIAAGGDVAVDNTSDQAVTVARPQETSGTNDFLAGNVADLDYALPVQITGNAASAIGNAASTNTSSQQSAAIGDIITDGTGGFVSGNVVAPQGATPLQVTSNAISGLGTATALSHDEDAMGAATKAAAGGTIESGGATGTGTGNVGAAALALPVEINSNAVGAGATSTSASSTEAAATAGDTRLGPYDRPTYIETDGNPSAVGGNVVEVPLAGPASLNCNAASGLGIADAACAATSPTRAGGAIQTNGENSLVGGTAGQTPVALPTEAFGNAGTIGGDAVATMDNTVTSNAGGGSFSSGAGSTVGGTLGEVAASGPVDVFSNAAAGAGDAVATNNNNSTTQSGGEFSGTNGTNSFVGGNFVNVPAALPSEGFGNVGGALGNAGSTVTEVKTSSAGSEISTKDDGGFLASNAVEGALAGPAQVFGNGVGGAGNTTSSADVVNTVEAGGPVTATGTQGTGAGNIGLVPVSLPAQLFGNNVTAGGVGVSDATADTTSTAGGAALSDGANGFLVGNVAAVPVGSVAQAFGDSAAALGQSSAIGSGITDSTAGGSVDTTGMGGFASGNVAAGQAMPVVQGLGTAVAGLGGLNDATGDNETWVSSGGNLVTNGDNGTISGNLIDVPAAATPILTGDAVSAIGSDALGTGASSATGTAGGSSITSGINGFLSGLDATLPAGINVPIYGVPIEVLAEAIAQATKADDFQVGEARPMVDMGLDGNSMSGLPVNSVPKLPMLSEFPSTPELTTMPELSDLTEMSAVPGLSELSVMPQESRIDTPVPGLDQLGSVTGVLGGLGGLGGGLPALPGGGGLPALPGGGGLPALPGGGGASPLPLGGDVVEGMPALGVLGAVTGLAGGLGEAGMPAALPQVPGTAALQEHLPTTASLQEHLPVLPELPAGPATRADSPLPAVPGLGPVTNLLGALMGGAANNGVPGVPQLPALPAGAQAGQLPSLPAVGAVPGVPALPGLPVRPSVPGLPNLTQAPMVQVPTVGKLPVATGLSGVDTSSLADTKSMLAKLLGEHPIG